MRIFLMCGAFVGVTGTVIGTVLGVLFCCNIEAIQHFGGGRSPAARCSIPRCI